MRTMESQNSQQNDTQTRAFYPGDHVKSRMPTDRFRRSGEILNTLDHGVVIVKWDLLQDPERMREQSLIKAEAETTL